MNKSTNQQKTNGKPYPNKGKSNKKNFNSKSKLKVAPKVPNGLNPTLEQKIDGEKSKILFTEQGLFNKKALEGLGRVMVKHDYSPKKPIYVILSSDTSKAAMDSMIFNVNKKDVTVTVRTKVFTTIYQGKDVELISVEFAIFDVKGVKLTPPIKNFKSRYVGKVYVPFIKDKSDPSGISQRTVLTIMKKIKLMHDKKFDDGLYPIISAAIVKSLSTTRTYAIYKQANILEESVKDDFKAVNV